jgi:hypothetical protein
MRTYSVGRCTEKYSQHASLDDPSPAPPSQIGFYNRKFFLLFLFYTICLLGFTLVSIAPQLPDIFDWVNRGDGLWLPPLANMVLLVVTLLVDAVLLFMLCPFLLMHFRMAMKNETSIDGNRFPQYDVGTRANLQQVFGRNVSVWLIPLYCSGPDGDGVDWPVKETSSDTPPGHAHRTSPYATTDSPPLLVGTSEPASDSPAMPLRPAPAVPAIEHQPSSSAAHPTPIARGQSGVAMVSIPPVDSHRSDGEGSCDMGRGMGEGMAGMVSR